ncbi:MAG: TlpA family protein disulfide reductase [Acidimicrobiia bacterium]
MFVAAALVAGGWLMSGRPGREPDRIALEGPAPPFDLPRLGDAAESVSLAAHRGTPVVVNFWASWCVPCRQEMPALEAVFERVDGQVAFIGVNHQDREVAALEFEAAVGVRYASGFDPAGDVAASYGLFGLPSTVLVDERGMIVARRLGEVTEAELEDLVRRAFGVEVGTQSR